MSGTLSRSATLDESMAAGAEVGGSGGQEKNGEEGRKRGKDKRVGFRRWQEAGLPPWSVYRK